MKIKATLSILFSFSFTLIFAQPYLMDGSTNSITTCGSFLLDSGAGDQPYGPNENYTMTICADGSEGTHAQLIFSGTDIASGDDLCFFDGPNTLSPSLGCASDFNGGSAFIIQATAANVSGCLTLVFNSNASGEGAGWSADINCVPSCQLIEAVLISTIPPVEPVDTGYIDICPGDEIQFSGTGNFPQNGVVYSHSNATSQFEWSFGDGTTAEGPLVSHIYEEAGGYIVQLTITDQLGCKSTNFLRQRVRVATRPNFNMGGGLPIEICVDDTIHLNSLVNVVDDDYVVSTIPTEGHFQAGAVRSDSLALPDGNGVSYETTVSFTDFAPGQALPDGDLIENICVNMEHSWMRDLEIMLTCPSGQSIILHNHAGQSGGEVFLGSPVDNDGFNPTPGSGGDYCWVNDSGLQTWIEYGDANEDPWSFDPLLMPEGDYRPYESFDSLEGCPLNGDWTITVTDLWPIDNGFIFSWGILFNNDLYPNLERFTPNLVDWNWALAPHAYFQTQDSVSAAPQNAGNLTYNFMVIDEFGCEHDTMVNLTVLPPTHPDCYNCEEILSPHPDTVICEDEPVDLNVLGNIETETAVTFESYPLSKFNAESNPPATPLSSGILINNIFPNTIQDPFNDIESVCVDISTEAAGNLRLHLYSPNGFVLTLSTNNGGQNNDYTQTCFTPDASTGIQFGTAPFTGNWQPESSWNQLNGATTNGEWRLEVSDIFNTDTENVLNWWSITFKSQNEITYDWSPSGDLSCTNCPDPTITTDQTTDLFVQASDIHGCTSSENIQIDVFPGFAAPQLDFEMISGGMIEFTWDEVAPGVSYEVNINNMGWISPNNGTLSHIVSGLMNGDDVNFEVRVAISNTGCNADIDQEFVTFLMCDLFDAFISGDNPPFFVSCPGLCDKLISISAQNGVAPFTYTATHSSGNTWTQNNGQFTGLCAGDYTIEVEDAAGCIDEVQFTISEPPAIVLNASQAQPVTCFGDSDGMATVMAFGGTVSGDYGYIWSDPISQITQTAVGLTANTYTVTVTDDNMCEATADVTITEPDDLTANVNVNPVFCFGEATGSAFISVFGGNPGTPDFDWGGVGSNPNQASNSQLPAGDYIVTVTDPKGCELLVDVSVTEPSTPLTIVVQQTIEGCDGEPTSAAMVTPMGGTPGYSYQWSNAQQSNIATGLSTQNYTVTVTDGFGCTVVGDIDITDLEPLELNINFTPPTCNGLSDGQMGVSWLSGGGANDINCTGCQYNWSNFGNTAAISNLQGGLNYQVTVTDIAGCTGIASAFLPEPEPITFDINPDNASCFGYDDGQATVENVMNEIGNITYQWDINAQSQITQTATNLLSGIYSVTVTDDNMCTAEETVEIGQPDEILVNFEVQDNRCNGDSEGGIDVAATGGNPGFSFLWSTGETSQKIGGLPAGDYMVTVTDAIGCTTEQTVTVGEPEAVDADIVGTDVTCFGDRDGMLMITPMGGTPPFSYSTDGENYFGSSTLIGLEAGNYAVFIKDGNDCVSQQEGIIGEPEEFMISVSYQGNEVDEIELDLGESANVWVVNSDTTKFFGDEVIWMPAYCGALFFNGTSDCDTIVNTSAATITPENPLFINIIAFDHNGCEAETMLQIRVNKERRVLVPTGFSPNNDGVNDKLLVHGKSGTMITSFRVFDRWGEMVFQANGFPINDPDIGWDGKFKAEDVPSGVYIWHLNVEFSDGREEMFTGSTTLIR